MCFQNNVIFVDNSLKIIKIFRKKNLIPLSWINLNIINIMYFDAIFIKKLNPWNVKGFNVFSNGPMKI